MEDLPSSFGKQERSRGDTLDDINDRYKLYERAQLNQSDQKSVSGHSSSNESSDSDDDDDDDELDKLPLSHQLPIETTHEKQISSISLDKSGARMVSAAYDGYVKFFDFSSMDTNNRSPFKSIEPLESHQIHQASFSPSGSELLVIPRHSRAKLFSRDGKESGEYARGDMYLVDMKNTKGHVSEITQGKWNSFSSGASKEFATAGFDSTVRIWDAEKFSSQKSVIVMKPKKTQVTALSWISNNALVCASTDGLIRLWDPRGSLMRPKLEAHDAHIPNTYTSCVCPLSIDAASTMLISRGGTGDDTVKIWDTRQFKVPLLTRRGLMSTSEELSVVPILTGEYLATASDHDLHILDPSDLMTVLSIPFSSPVTQVHYSATLNQLFVGLKTGELNVLFSRDLSTKGAKSVVESMPRARHIDDMNTVNISLQGLNEAIIKQERAQELRHEDQRRRQRGLKDQTSMPAKPNPGVWGTPSSEHVQQNVNLSEMNSEDPREALLKFADRASKDPRFEHFKSDGDNDPHDAQSKKQKTV